ncbi:hypothetical protein BH11PLA2_BH11PLA2_27260 [soil metagenome]
MLAPQKTTMMQIIDALELLVKQFALEPNVIGDGKFEFSPANALWIKYRLLLGRAPDPNSIVEMHDLSPSDRELNVVRALESPEFNCNICYHIDRIRRHFTSPVTWHFHLPRTAGSKWVSDWKRQGGHVIAIPLFDPGLERGWNSIANELIVLNKCLQRNSRILISGHIAFRNADRFVRGEDSIIATVRHPVERAVSLYRYAVAMCQRRGVVNYPGSERVQNHFENDWHRNVSAANLDPDHFSIAEFFAAGFCADNQYANYFAQTDDVENLGTFMKHAGYTVVFQEQLSSSETPVNATLPAVIDGNTNDQQWLTAFLKRDIKHYESIVRVFSNSTNAVD